MMRVGITQCVTPQAASSHAISFARAFIALCALAMGMLLRQPSAFAQQTPTGQTPSGPETAPVASAAPDAYEAAPLNVVVTVPSLKGIVEPLLPKGSSVQMLMKPGRSEHGYEFTASDLAELSRADIVVYIGLGLETRVENALQRKRNPIREVVCFADVLGLKQGDAHHHHEPGEVCSGDHGEGWVDQHLWLDPVLVSSLVPALETSIRSVLTSKRALNETAERGLSAAARQHISNIDLLHREYESRLAPARGRAIITHHDAFSRMADRYGLRVAAVIRPGQAAESTPADIARVVEAVQESKVKAIFFEPQFSVKAAQRIASNAGVELRPLDPLGDGDWFAMMRTNLESLATGLASEPAAPSDQVPASPAPSSSTR
jgi:zinc transport system substrate-binding protein